MFPICLCQEFGVNLLPNKSKLVSKENSMKKAAILFFFLVIMVGRAEAQQPEPMVSVDWMSYSINTDERVIPVAFTQEKKSAPQALFYLFFPPEACAAPMPCLTLLSPSDSSLAEASAYATIKIGGNSFDATASFVHDAEEISIPLAFRNVPSLIQAARGGRTLLIELEATANTPKINLSFSLMGFSAAYEHAESLCRSQAR